ncbi:hypothetical protein QFW96_15370 [Saccharopolyspora sp. TS4A08]|uniref:Uncharacterized protein n=1 Tax=Saccharopolyspora ipomoeae TaxID=3042027 RepID=A0ABT6PPZ2_9PSEU|nr:hypothetical protein [Saccharopolyspora sp. TS4A08]MDI2030009.1 hypothetical protein [Saccharopolyspora sp. TS4A08]
MTRKSYEEQARELAATTGRSYDDALRVVEITRKTRPTVDEAAFALGHPLAVLADGPTAPVVVGTSGLGPQLRDVRIAYVGTDRYPDFVVITSIPMPGEDVEDLLLTEVLSNFLRFRNKSHEELKRTSPRESWDRANAAVPDSTEIAFAGVTTRGTRISADGISAVRVPYLHGQIVVGTSGTDVPALALTG